jgi:hypothetical protein
MLPDFFVIRGPLKIGGYSFELPTTRDVIKQEKIFIL